MKLKTFLTTVLLLCLYRLATAQSRLFFAVGGLTEIETPFGHVPKADLEMTRYDPDTSANAVVLLDNGFLSLYYGEQGWKCYLTSFKRVKLLKKSSFDDYGKYSITLRSSEKLLGVKAQTVNPDSSITPVTTFFDEKDNKYVSRKKFAFSNLQEGSIVEYEYTVEGTDVFSLYPWYFQAEIPVRHSELVTDIPRTLEYIYFFRGQAPKQDEYTLNKKIEVKKKVILEPTTYFRYSLDSLEAMKSEGYVSTLSNHISNMKFQLSQINPVIGSDPPRKILQDWKALAKELMADKDLGEQLRFRSKYNDIWKAVKPLLATAQTDEEKIRIVYEFISQNVQWIDDYFGIYAQESSLDDAFKKKKANSGELNLMLIACLNEAGIKALPMLVSTRDHGLPYKNYPIGRQFNHVLCYIEGEKPMFLDAGNIYRPMNVPRVPSLNGAGWVLDEKNPRWVDIPTPFSSETMLGNFALLEDGTLKGNIGGSYLGYAAVDERTSLKDDEKNENLKKAWAKAFPDIQLDSIVVVNKDSLYLPFKRTMNCIIPNAAIVADDLMYIKPTLKTDFDENPFKQEKRNYPVELPYPIRDHFVLNMAIPDGYTIEELPKEMVLGLPNNGGKFIYSCTKMGNKIQLMVRIELKQLYFPVEEYPNIKSFFNQIVTKKNEQIVLKRMDKTETAKKKP